MQLQMQELLGRLTDMQGMLNTQAADQKRLTEQNEDLNKRLVAKEQQVAAATSVTENRGAPSTASVQKWAPDHLSGRHADWPDWCLKFRSYMGAMLQGQLGRWLDHVDSARDASALVSVLGEEARTSASLLHSALVATCQNAALTVVKRAGPSEGLEAWRNLLRKYEPRTKQTKVVRLLSVLSFSFKCHDIVDALERFEEECGEYEKEAGKTIDDDIKIGTTIRGIDDGPLREHLLLHSERCTNFADFRAEVETIARARANASGGASPMDIGAFSSQAQGAKFEGNCRNCGKPGHKAKDCYGPGGGAAKPGGRPGGKTGAKGSGKKGHQGNSGGGKSGASSDRKCFQCGMTNHVAKDCRASDEKKKKWKASQQGGKNFRELAEDDSAWPGQARDLPSGGDMGQFDLCQLCGQDFCEVSESDRTDETDREIIFAVDSAACRSVVNKKHRALRGYRTWKDKFYGQTYGTAKAGLARIHDEGLRVAQTKSSGMDPPMRLNTRQADVRKPLMAVCDMVDHNHSVLFDSSGSYAINKKTGRKTTFTRTARGWDLRLVLEAPAKANEVMAGVLAELREKSASSEQTVELKFGEVSVEQPAADAGFQWAARLQRSLQPRT